MHECDLACARVCVCVRAACVHVCMHMRVYVCMCMCTFLQIKVSMFERLCPLKCNAIYATFKNSKTQESQHSRHTQPSNKQSNLKHNQSLSVLNSNKQASNMHGYLACILCMHACISCMHTMHACMLRMHACHARMLCMYTARGSPRLLPKNHPKPHNGGEGAKRPTSAAGGGARVASDGSSGVNVGFLTLYAYIACMHA